MFEDIKSVFVVPLQNSNRPSAYILLFVSLVWFLVLNATFNTISIILWRSVVLMDETRVTGESHQLSASHWQTLSHNVISSTPRDECGSNSQL